MENTLTRPASTHSFGSALAAGNPDRQWQIAGAALIGLALIIGALFAPAFPFTTDGAIHAAMARAFADGGVFFIAGNGGIEGAPALQPISTHVLGDVAFPQYPSGYGVVAAPFYAALGLRGLVILNAISAALVLLLTYRIAAKLYGKNVAILSIPIIAIATFFSNYAFGIWPHMFSLLIWVAAAQLAVSADDSQRRQGRLIKIIAAGLIIGFGACVRVDIILAAPAIFLWLRLFARAHDRQTAVAFLAALAPGLIAAAFMNDTKFGVFSPFYYGPNPGPDSLSRYIWLAPILIVATLGLIAVNTPKAITGIRKRIGDRRLIIAILIGVMAVLGAGFSLVSSYLNSLYVLVFDLQMYNGYYVQEGVMRDDYGYLLFWGFPKRALLQSLPFAALAILPAVEIFRGEKLKQHSLCALIICAPICFYALNQWHGGGSYNMRYFLPSVPFIVMLSAYALLRVAKTIGAINRTHLLAAGVGGAVLFELFDTVRQDIAPQFFTPLALYPQLALALALAIAVAGFLVTRGDNKRISSITFFLAIVTLSYSGMVNLTDESGHEKARAEQLALSRAAARDIPADALVLTQLPVLLIDAERAGASVMYATEKNIAPAIKALSAFKRAGRCVYFQNSMVRDVIAPHLSQDAITARPFWAGRGEFPGDARLAFYGLASQAGICAF